MLSSAGKLCTQPLFGLVECLSSSCAQTTGLMKASVQAPTLQWAASWASGRDIRLWGRRWGTRQQLYTLSTVHRRFSWLQRLQARPQACVHACLPAFGADGGRPGSSCLRSVRSADASGGCSACRQDPSLVCTHGCLPLRKRVRDQAGAAYAVYGPHTRLVVAAPAGKILDS